MSERDEPSFPENSVPTRGFVSSPRGYFGRASRAAGSTPRAAMPEPPPAAAKAAPVYRAGDPALRLFPRLALPFPPATSLTGAVATLTGIADGTHERLLIELGASLVRASQERDEAGGALALKLSRSQSAETYRALLSSLRYVNDAAEPKAGLRKAVLEAVDAEGATQAVAATIFGVGDMAPECVPPPLPAAAAVPAAAAIETEAPPEFDERVVLGESIRFNGDGDYTLYWWPRLLPAPRTRARASEPAPEAAAAPGSFFSNGGKLYRVFDPQPQPERSQPERPQPERAQPAPPPPARPAAASDRTARADAKVADAKAPDFESWLPANDVWMPGRGLPLPGFERAPMLRLEDLFGSDMENALVRRLIEQRIAASA